MTSNDLRDQAALEQRLQALRADLRDALTKAHKRMWAVRLMLVLLVLLTTGYLFFLYHELSKLDAAAVTDLAYYKLQPYLDDSPTMLRDELRRRAPQLIGIAEKSVLDAPKVGGEYLRDVFNEQVKEAFNKAQPQVEPRHPRELPGADGEVEDRAASARGRREPGQTVQAGDHAAPEAQGWGRAFGHADPRGDAGDAAGVTLPRARNRLFGLALALDRLADVGSRG
ncbi:MAG: hypothetical protein NTW19_05670 [Planctomycetota bacterium]|nr:hypothetical protein [Planctomycetota bacterium]